MKLLFSLSLVAVLSCAVAAQGKIAIINSTQFTADKGGITKLVNAYSALEVEFKSASDEITQINTKLATLSKDIAALQDQINKPGANVQALRDQMTQKDEEGQNLQITLKRKQEDAKAKYERREQTLTGPIIKEISDAIDAYAKAHGYDLVLDGAKLDSLMAFNPAIDITDAFIKEFNAKSSGIPIKQ